jgi:hypothetical protein
MSMSRHLPALSPGFTSSAGLILANWSFQSEWTHAQFFTCCIDHAQQILIDSEIGVELDLLGHLDSTRF